MIITEYIHKEVKKYSLDTNIQLKDGKVKKENMTKIKTYIKKMVSRDKIHTRRMEERSNWKMGFPLFLNQLVGRVVFSPIEQYLWEALKDATLPEAVERQHKIGPYTIDIAYPKIKLAVECDGKEYHEDDKRQIERDQRRDKYLARRGWRIIRISGIEIRRNIGACVEKIKGGLS